MGKQKNIQVLLALGSNLGERAEQILTAWRRLDENPSVRTVQISRFIVTKPTGGPEDQPNFFNAAGVLETTLDPWELLELLQSIEKEGGRERHQFWGARTIDLDLILFGNEVVRTPHLTIPHPRMAWRPFVLIPASEIAPNMIHPIFHLTVRQLLDLAQTNFRLTSMMLYKTLFNIPEPQGGGCGLPLQSDEFRSRFQSEWQCQRQSSSRPNG